MLGAELAPQYNIGSKGVREGDGVGMEKGNEENLHPKCAFCTEHVLYNMERGRSGRMKFTMH